MENIFNPEPEKAPFGYCPWCGHSVGLSNDDEWWEDPQVTVRYLECQHCGCSIEAIQCPIEERKNYPYWKEDGRKLEGN